LIKPVSAALDGAGAAASAPARTNPLTLKTTKLAMPIK